MQHIIFNYLYIFFLNVCARTGVAALPLLSSSAHFLGFCAAMQKIRKSGRTLQQVMAVENFECIHDGNQLASNLMESGRHFLTWM